MGAEGMGEDAICLLPQPGSPSLASFSVGFHPGSSATPAEGLGWGLSGYLVAGGGGFVAW